MTLLECKKCDGQNTVKKYCLACKHAFCEDINTTKVFMKAPKEADIIDTCPECGSEKIIHLGFN
jgi:hypothetical protein